MTGPL